VDPFIGHNFSDMLCDTGSNVIQEVTVAGISSLHWPIYSYFIAVSFVFYD